MTRESSNQYHNLAQLTAEAHGLYLRLRDRLDSGESPHPAVRRSYRRYRRRVTRLRSSALSHRPAYQVIH